MCEREGEGEYVCIVCECFDFILPHSLHGLTGEGVVLKRERERERERVWSVCVCVRERGRECVCVVCVIKCDTIVLRKCGTVL